MQYYTGVDFGTHRKYATVQGIQVFAVYFVMQLIMYMFSRNIGLVS